MMEWSKRCRECVDECSGGRSRECSGRIEWGRVNANEE